MTRDEFRNQVLAIKDRLHSFCVWMLRDRDEACDVTQEAFLRLWQHHRRVKTACAATWLLRTAHRLCLDRLRLRLRKPEVTLEEATVGGNGRVSPPDPLRRVELRPTIADALNELPCGERAVLVLREIEGLSYEQIATVLDRSLSSVKVSLHRGRKRLRERLSRVLKIA